VQPAAGGMPAGDGRVRRRGGADLHRVRAAQPEPAARVEDDLAPLRRGGAGLGGAGLGGAGLGGAGLGGAGLLPLAAGGGERLAGRARVRRGRGEQPGVRVRRAQDHLVGRAVLDDLPPVHHHDPGREVPRGGQVVGDVQQREVALPLQPVEQVEDLQPDRDVQHRHRLIGQQHLGARGERAGDRHPLPLPPGQLVRPGPGDLVLRREVHRPQQLVHVGVQPGPGMAGMQHQGRPRQVVPHGVHRVQRRERILEDQLDPPAVPAQRAPAPPGGPAVEQHLAAGGAEQPPDRAHHRGLAGAALADQGQGLSFFYPERAVVHRPEAAPAPLPEVDGQLAHLEDGHAVTSGAGA
jgi:hypothetical protein